MQTKFINKFFNFWDRDDLAVIMKWDSSISYKELFQRSKNIAEYLSEHNISKNTYVPLLIIDQIKFIESVIALWYLGAIPVPLNTKLVDDEISLILEDCDFKFLITDKEFSPNRRQKDLNRIELNEITFSGSSNKNFSFPTLDDEAIVIFTSGSSGKPKGVVHTFSSLINNIKSGNNILDLKEGDRWLASLPFYHIGGFQIICRSLFYGCSIIIPESQQTNHLADAIVKNKPSHLSLVSTQLKRLINDKIIPDKSLKVSLIGGGFVEDELMFKADKLGWKPFRVYGSSETGSLITAISAEEIIEKPQSVGKVFSNVEIIISDDSEILIKSNSLFKKYLDDQKETSLKLIYGFYHSGDLGFVDNDVYLFIEARRNDLIVTGGENVNPIEVESALKQITGVIEACVFAKQSKTWGQKVAAAIVINDLSLNEKSIKGILKQKLAGYKIPKQFYFLDELPKTSLGKLERDKIKKMF
ncbi:MAG: o-succinylbenzoate--CoA ligase [Ignavibacteriota bacterium]